MGNTVNMMIVGAQKAGTTSLNNYLSQHPKIYTHNTLEFGLFLDDASYKRGLDYYLKNTVSEDVKRNKEKSVFVAKRVGLMNNEAMLEKLYEFNPDVKIVAVLRNPIDRAYSAYQYCRQNGIEPYDKFEDALFINDMARFGGNSKHQRDCDYIGRSNYLMHLKKLYSIFPAENIKLFLLEEIVTNFNSYLNEMCAFVGLEAYSFNTSVKYNEASDPKSQTVAKLLASGKKNRLVNIIPLKLRIKIKQQLKNINRVNKQGSNNKLKEPKHVINNETRAYLKSIFSVEMKELENFTNLPLQKYWPEFF